MSPHEKELPSKVSREILKYLAKHPDAQDTLEGICEWWLLKEQAQRGFKRVIDALELLASEGLIVKKTAIDKRIHYRLNKRKYKRILKLTED